MTEGDPNSPERRIGRAVTRVHQARAVMTEDLRTHLGSLLATGDAMDFVARIHGFTGMSMPLNDTLLRAYAQQASIPAFALTSSHLPALAAANVVTYQVDAQNRLAVQEFLGVTGTFIEQTARVFTQFHPSRDELALVHSVEIGGWAPMTEQQHLQMLTDRGFTDQEAESGYRLSRAAKINQRAKSDALNENVVYNRYVWQARDVKIAEFLARLPPNERDVLLGISEQAAQHQGMAVSDMQLPSAGLFKAARNVGLIQSATVKSSGTGAAQQTYVFSPMNDGDDDALLTTEALHLRKLFVAHILFGNEMAAAQGGRIREPVTLVSALMNRGSVGPATNIGTDYHLLEAAGIVQVDGPPAGMAFLRLVNREIVEGGLEWLRAAGSYQAGTSELKLLRSPGGFDNPENDAATPIEDPAAAEVGEAAVLKLREELRSGARQDQPFAFGG